MSDHRPPAPHSLVLPPIHNPQRYGGLYVYDFGDHVSLGYTAAEIRVLRESAAHGGGTAYEIYRVDESGAMELRGVLDDRLTRRESLCLLRHDGADARRDYDALRKASDSEPIGCPVEMQLAKLYAFDPPHVTALSYISSATSVVAGWLLRHAPNAGDEVACGSDEHARLAASDGVRIASCELRTKTDFGDRSAEEVLAQVDRALQR